MQNVFDSKDYQILLVVWSGVDIDIAYLNHAFFGAVPADFFRENRLSIKTILLDFVGADVVIKVLRVNEKSPKFLSSPVKDNLLYFIHKLNVLWLPINF